MSRADRLLPANDTLRRSDRLARDSRGAQQGRAGLASLAKWPNDRLTGRAAGNVSPIINMLFCCVSRRGRPMFGGGQY